MEREAKSAREIFVESFKPVHAQERYKAPKEERVAAPGIDSEWVKKNKQKEIEEFRKRFGKDPYMPE